MAYEFHVEQVTEELIQWIRDWFAKNGPMSPAVIGISGGKDSSTVAALCVRALGKERVLGVLMPEGVQPDIDYSRLLVDTLGIKHVEVNIKPMVDAAKAQLAEAGLEMTRQAQINLPARIRMTTLYAVSQCVGGRVSCNCNLSENVCGYSTRFGDDAGDFAPLFNLTVAEVKQIGAYLGLPEKLTQKAPSDGLTGKTDEDNLGFTYAELDDYIRGVKTPDEPLRTTILRRYKANRFKLETIKCYPNEAYHMAEDFEV